MSGIDGNVIEVLLFRRHDAMDPIARDHTHGSDRVRWKRESLVRAGVVVRRVRRKSAVVGVGWSYAVNLSIYDVSN